MTNSQRLAAIRLRLKQWLAQHAGCESDEAPSDEHLTRSIPGIRRESLLIRGGFYCGRQFDAGQYRAVWFMEEDELKISTRDGKRVCSLRGDELIPLELELAEADSGVDHAQEDDAHEDQERAVIPMSHASQDSRSVVESTDNLDSDEQAARRAA